MPLQLVFTKSDGITEGSKFPLSVDKDYTVGTKLESDIRIQRVGVSESHVLISVSENSSKAWIKCLSDRGIKVGDLGLREGEKVELDVGDTIDIAGRIILVKQIANTSKLPLPVSQRPVPALRPVSADRKSHLPSPPKYSKMLSSGGAKAKYSLKKAVTPARKPAITPRSTSPYHANCGHGTITPGRLPAKQSFVRPTPTKSFPLQRKATPTSAKGAPFTKGTPLQRKSSPGSAKSTPALKGTPLMRKATPVSAKGTLATKGTPLQRKASPGSVKGTPATKKTPAVRKATPEVKKSSPRKATPLKPSTPKNAGLINESGEDLFPQESTIFEEEMPEEYADLPDSPSRSPLVESPPRQAYRTEAFVNLMHEAQKHVMSPVSSPRVKIPLSPKSNALLEFTPEADNQPTSVLHKTQETVAQVSPTSPKSRRSGDKMDFVLNLNLSESSSANSSAKASPKSATPKRSPKAAAETQSPKKTPVASPKISPKRKAASPTQAASQASPRKTPRKSISPKNTPTASPQIVQHSPRKTPRKSISPKNTPTASPQIVQHSPKKTPRQPAEKGSPQISPKKSPRSAVKTVHPSPQKTLIQVTPRASPQKSPKNTPKNVQPSPQKTPMSAKKRASPRSSSEKDQFYSPSQTPVNATESEFDLSLPMEATLPESSFEDVVNTTPVRVKSSRRSKVASSPKASTPKATPRSVRRTAVGIPQTERLHVTAVKSAMRKRFPSSPSRRLKLAQSSSKKVVFSPAVQVTPIPKIGKASWREFAESEKTVPRPILFDDPNLDQTAGEEDEPPSLKKSTKSRARSSSPKSASKSKTPQSGRKSRSSSAGTPKSSKKSARSPCPKQRKSTTAVTQAQLTETVQGQATPQSQHKKKRRTWESSQDSSFYTPTSMPSLTPKATPKTQPRLRSRAAVLTPHELTESVTPEVEMEIERMIDEIERKEGKFDKHAHARGSNASSPGPSPKAGSSSSPKLKMKVDIASLVQLANKGRTDRSPSFVAVESPKRAPKRSAVSPKLEGVRELLAVAKDNASPQLSGIKKMMRTPRQAKSPKLSGIKVMVKTPRPVKSPRLSGVEAMVKTPAPVKAPTSSAVKTPKALAGFAQKTAKTPRFEGLRKLVKTPKTPTSPTMDGMKELMQSPEKRHHVFDAHANEQMEDTLNMSQGMIQGASPVLTGVSRLFRTPKAVASPDYTGVEHLFNLPQSTPLTMKQLTLSAKKSGGKSFRFSHVAPDSNSPVKTRRSVRKTPAPAAHDSFVSTRNTSKMGIDDSVSSTAARKSTRAKANDSAALTTSRTAVKRNASKVASDSMSDVKTRPTRARANKVDVVVQAPVDEKPKRAARQTKQVKEMEQESSEVSRAVDESVDEVKSSRRTRAKASDSAAPTASRAVVKRNAPKVAEDKSAVKKRATRAKASEEVVVEEETPAEKPTRASRKKKQVEETKEESSQEESKPTSPKRRGARKEGVLKTKSPTKRTRKTVAAKQSPAKPAASKKVVDKADKEVKSPAKKPRTSRKQVKPEKAASPVMVRATRSRAKK